MIRDAKYKSEDTRGTGHTVLGTLKQVPALTRGIAVLRLLGKTGRPMRVSEIAKGLRLIPSTCLHILRVLVEEELVALDSPTKTYTLDAGVLRISAPILRRDGFVARAQPELVRVTQQFQVLAMAVKIVSRRHFIVMTTARAEDCAISIEIGTRAPALASATGRCVAAFTPLSSAELRRAFALLKWNRPPTFATWLRAIERTRITGYSLDDGETVAGLTVIAAPILSSSGLMTHGISIVGFSEQLSNIGIEVLGELARNVARKIGPGGTA